MSSESKGLWPLLWWCSCIGLGCQPALRSPTPSEQPAPGPAPTELLGNWAQQTAERTLRCDRRSLPDPGGETPLRTRAGGDGVLWVLVEQGCELPFTRHAEATWSATKDSACGSRESGRRVRDGALTRTSTGLAMRLSYWSFLQGVTCEASLRGTWTPTPAGEATP
ncbi:hypothetical protein OV208_18390 [Corallococcus sp. bb12-1]|uniref:hypothetical protein n=1 Tax=Corallococcus sp. bb12-1 TaxID=2996784 RepID=UPI0022709B73|nr:hypothetical protein [Corallococcus sp. bb12-1]MCY1043292.1 hypothetical protein [Corallococcus sp. bb12-1]